MKKKITLLVAGATLFNANAMVMGVSFFPKASASTTTSSILTTASVQPNCTFASNGVSLSFGSYNPASQNLNSTTTFDVRCTKTAAVTLGLNNGINSSGSTRRMKNIATTSSDYLVYQLYKDAAHSTVWNNTNTVNFTSTSAAPHTFIIYGQVPSGQVTVGGGSYDDTMTITATF